VIFKHKYITQRTITPADAIVNTYNKLRQAIQGLQHSKDDAHFKALERIENIMQQSFNQTDRTPCETSKGGTS
jgi:hypothetical protein